MSYFIIKNNKGIALLVTISVISILITVALELNRKVRASITLASTSKDRVTLSYMASSGINAGITLLLKDKMDNKSDSFLDDWANSVKIEEAIKSIPFDEGTITIKISDETGKIQVNSLVDFPKGKDFNEPQKILWDRFLRNIISQNKLSQEVEDPTAVINCVKDWIDSGDDDAITGLNGAESDYYKSLDPPYSCRNGPIIQLNELLLIKNITPGLYKAIYKYMTIYGMKKTDDKSEKENTKSEKNNFTFDGKININTAELQVIAAMLPTENADLAKSLYEYRQDIYSLKKEYDFTNPTWYKNAPGLNEVTIDPKIITVSSNFFCIESTAALNNMKMTITAMIKREGEKKENEKDTNNQSKFKILSWNIE